MAITNWDKLLKTVDETKYKQLEEDTIRAIKEEIVPMAMKTKITGDELFAVLLMVSSGYIRFLFEHDEKWCKKIKQIIREKL